MSDTSSDAPSDALMQLLAPDGYYTYLGIPKNAVPVEPTAGTANEERNPLQNNATTNQIDVDLVKKNYRKLSLKHHPDKRGGDVDTFRVLNRAQRVLMNPKLRQQYDILGIDLDDDEEEHKEEESAAHEDQSTAQGIVQEIAGMALAGIIQLAVRTGT